MIFISCLSLERRRKVYPQSSRQVFRIHISFYRHEISSSKFSLNTIGKRSGIISRNGNFGLFINMQFFRRIKRTDADIASTTATAHSRQAINRDTCYFGHFVIIAGMSTRIAIRTNTNHPKRYGCSRCQLTIIARSTHEEINILRILSRKCNGTNHHQ